MNASINDGGPAFPCPHHTMPEVGMSLRDWFAGKALCGLLAAPNVYGSVPELAKCAYEYADAMIKAREELQ